MSSLLLKITSADWLSTWFLLEFISIIIIALGCAGEVYSEIHKFSDKIRASPEGGRLTEKILAEKIRVKWKVIWGMVVVLGLAIELIAFSLSFFASNREINRQEQRIEELRKHNDLLTLHSGNRIWVLMQQTDNGDNRFILDLKDSPKGTAKIFVAEGDTEATFVGGGLKLLMSQAGWTVIPPKTISKSQISKYFLGGSVGGGGIVLIASSSEPIEPKVGLLPLDKSTLNSTHVRFKTDTAFRALNESFWDCGFICQVGGFSSEPGGTVEIVVGPKNW